MELGVLVILPIRSMFVNDFTIFSNVQLSLEIDEQNTSKSSTSSTVAASEKLGNSSGLSSVTKDDQDVTSSTLEGRPDPLQVQVS